MWEAPSEELDGNVWISHLESSNFSSIPLFRISLWGAKKSSPVSFWEKSSSPAGGKFLCKRGKLHDGVCQFTWWQKSRVLFFLVGGAFQWRAQFSVKTTHFSRHVIMRKQDTNFTQQFLFSRTKKVNPSIYPNFFNVREDFFWHFFSVESLFKSRFKKMGLSVDFIMYSNVITLSRDLLHIWSNKIKLEKPNCFTENPILLEFWAQYLLQFHPFEFNEHL